METFRRRVDGIITLSLRIRNWIWISEFFRFVNLLRLNSLWIQIIGYIKIQKFL